MQLKGCLYRKFFGDDKMFGKKKKEDVPQQQPQIQPPYPQPQIPQQPMYPQQQQPQMPMPQPMMPMQPVETPTPFCISERIVQQVPQMMQAGSGQLVPTGQMENKETIKIIQNLSLEDLLTIVQSVSSNSAISMKVKELMKRMMK